MVVLKHAGNFYTVYAHHSKNMVKIGQKVEKGQLIAYSGRTGHASGPHLHFELRQGTQSYDPEYAFNGYFKVSANRKIASKSHLNHDFEE
jgi:murein DD-endopeptidase MepM/ murein hydrolase activator NlpD